MDVNGFYANFIEAVRHAAGDGPILLLWGLAYAYLWLAMPQVRRGLFAIAVMAAFLANPLTGGLALSVVEGSQPFSRFIWLLFPELICAIAACDLVFARRKRWLGGLIGVACLALVAISGKPLTTREFFEKPENKYELSQPALMVGEYLQARQAEENKGGNRFAARKAERSVHTRAVVADALCYDIRQALSGVHLEYGRRGVKVKNRIESRLIDSGDEKATKAYFKRLRAHHVTAIVLQKDEAIAAVMEHYGWIPADEVAGYTVYEPKKKKNQ